MGKQQKQMVLWTLQEQSARETGGLRSRRKTGRSGDGERWGGLCSGAAARTGRRGSTREKLLRTPEIC